MVNDKTFFISGSGAEFTYEITETFSDKDNVIRFTKLSEEHLKGKCYSDLIRLYDDIAVSKVRVFKRTTQKDDLSTETSGSVVEYDYVDWYNSSSLLAMSGSWSVVISGSTYTYDVDVTGSVTESGSARGTISMRSPNYMKWSSGSGYTLFSDDNINFHDTYSITWTRL